MTRKNVPESEQKLLILLALRCLGGVTQLQLLRFMVEEDVMNYFVLQLNLCELEEMGQVRVCHHALGSLYELTEQGRYTLDSFDSHIPASRRQALEAGAARWKAQFRAEQQNLSLVTTVGFQSFKNLLAIVEAFGKRIQFDRAIGNNAGIMPALPLVIIHDKHVVGKNFAKTERRARRRFRFWIFR